MKKPPEGGFFVPDQSQVNDPAKEEWCEYCAYRFRAYQADFPSSGH